MGGAAMTNSNVIIIGMALLVLYLIMNSGLRWVVAFVSVVLIVGAIRHPEVALQANVHGTPDDQLQSTMVMVGLILGIPMLFWLKRGRK
jgi:hypothetical protein